MNKKGFTLIELIAVIVILAIILLIAVPKVLTIIETSRKNTLVSGTKLIAKAIQSDSVSSKKQYYKLDSDGKLYRCDDGISCNSTTEIKYNGKVIPLSGDSIILVKNTDGTVELQQGGTICDSKKKNCVSAADGPVALKTIKKEDLKPASAITTLQTSTSVTTTTTSGQRTILSSGDITGSGPINSVTYVQYSDGTLEINGNGQGQMRNFDFIEGVPNSLVMQLNSGFFLDAIEEHLVEGLELNDIPADVLTNLKSLNIVYGLYTVDDIASFIYENDDEGEFETLQDAKNAILEIMNGLFGENGEYVYNHLGAQNQYINSVIIHEGVLNIGDAAFVGSLNNISIADSVTTIGLAAFVGFSNNLSLDLGEGVQTIGFGAFMMNRGLHSLIIPSSVTAIDENAFFQTGLTSITIEGNQTRFNNNWTSIGFPPELMPN